MNTKNLRSYDSKTPNIFGEYEITIRTTDHAEYLALEKVAHALIDGKIKSPSNVRICPDKTNLEERSE